MAGRSTVILFYSSFRIVCQGMGIDLVLNLLNREINDSSRCRVPLCVREEKTGTHWVFYKPGFHWRISTSTSTCVSKWKLGRHKLKHNKKTQRKSACAYAYVVGSTSENGVDISTRPWTNHRSLWPRPHANISKAIWRMFFIGLKRAGIENCVKYAILRVRMSICLYALVKTRLKSLRCLKGFKSRAEVCFRYI